MKAMTGQHQNEKTICMDKFVVKDRKFNRRNLKFAAVGGFLYGFSIFMGRILLRGEWFYLYFTQWKSFVYLLASSAIFGLIPFIIFFFTVLVIRNIAIHTDDTVRPKRKYFHGWYWIECTIFLVAYIPCFVAFDHGIISYDASSVIAQAAGKETKTNFQPYFHTLIWQAFYVLEKKTGIPGLAITAYSIVQWAFIVTVFVFIMKIGRDKLGSGKPESAFSFLFYALNPVIVLFTFVLTKDIYFGGCFALYSLLLTCLITSDVRSGYRWFRLICLMTIMGLFGSLFRNNFIYVIAGMLMVGAVGWMKVRKNSTYKAIALSSTLIIIFYGIIIGPVYSAAGVAPSPSREAMSVPLSQIGAVYRIRAEELTSEEKKNVLRYMPSVNDYDPMNADKVKNTFNQEYYNAHKKQFWKLYLALLKKYPGDYCDAFLFLHLPYVYPDLNIVPYIETGGFIDPDYPIEKKNLLPSVKEFYEDAASNDEGFKSIYCIRVLFSLHWPFWILIVCIACVLLGRQYRLFLALMPSIGLWGTYLLGPLCNYRYIYPLVILYPLYFGLARYSLGNVRK